MKPLVLIVVLWGVVRGSAEAQTRAYIAINGAYQTTSREFRDSLGFTEYVEEGTIESDYSTEAGPQIDVAGGVRLWRNLAFGVGVTRFIKSAAASVHARIPHPFFFSRYRDVSGVASGIEREEIGVHVQAVWLVPVTQRFQIALFGGPSIFSVKQGLVSEVDWSESYPYDTASFSGARSGMHSESAAGFNVGTDVAFLLGRYVGVGGTVRFSGASVDLPSVDGDTVAIDAGGLQVGGGLRLRFP
jgi:hypothetical protein